MKTLSTLPVLLLAMIATVNMNAQDSGQLALGIEAYSSGNTHGTFFMPYAGIERGRNFVSLGMLVHKQSSMIKGMKLGYSRNLSGNAGRTCCDLLQINFTGYLQYSEQLPMSAYVVREQYLVNSVNDVRWEQVQLSTAEAAAGIELRVNLTSHISWRNTVAMALHYHTKYVTGLSRERAGLSLGLGTGLMFVLP